jgi:tetrahydromethanopterin S-methyltransferase subunit E
MMMEISGEFMNSPFVIPVAGCLTGLGIAVAGIWSNVRSREMKSQERLAAIARGIPLPPTAEELAIIHGKPSVDSTRRRGNVRRWGIVLLGFAAGLILFFITLASVLHERDVLCGAAVGLIPLGIGVGLLIDARIQTREIEEATLQGSGPFQGSGPRGQGSEGAF